MLSVLSIFQISPFFSKEEVRILKAISLLYSLQAAQGHNYNHPECAYAISFLFLLPALSNRSQLPQCRQNWRQLQHCLSSKCRKQSSRDVPEVSGTDGHGSESAEETTRSRQGARSLQTPRLAPCQAHKASRKPWMLAETWPRVLQIVRGKEAADETEFSSGKEKSSGPAPSCLLM